MAKIKIENIPDDKEFTREEMKKITGGFGGKRGSGINVPYVHPIYCTCSKCMTIAEQDLYKQYLILNQDES